MRRNSNNRPDPIVPGSSDADLRKFWQELPKVILLTVGGALVGYAVGPDMYKGIAGGAGLGLIFAYIRISFIPPMRPKTGRGSGPEISMQAWIALFFMAAFFFAIGQAFLMTDRTTNGKEFLEIFKSGVTLLGATVTTVVGYYFGNRTAATAERVAQAALESRSGEEPPSAEPPGPEGDVGTIPFLTQDPGEPPPTN